MKSAPKWLLVLAVCVSFIIVHSNSRSDVAADPTGQYRYSRKLENDDLGYISIDCGVSKSYKDSKSKIWFQADTDFVKAGENHILTTDNSFGDDEPHIGHELNTLRSFPNGERNCYILRPKHGKNNRYIIRASFAYRNYDNKNTTPVFDVYLGVNYKKTIEFDSVKAYFPVEVIHFSTTDTVNVCLVNINKGIPFISSLELWLLTDSSYLIPNSQSLDLMTQSILGVSQNALFIRNQDDIYGRVWFNRQNISNSISINTSAAIRTSERENTYKLPTEVLSTAIQSSNINSSLTIYYDSNIDWSSEYYIYFHFFEFEQRTKDQKRIMDITINDVSILENPFTPEYWKPVTITRNVTRKDYLRLSIKSTSESELPAMINAFEIYKVILENSTTGPQDDGPKGKNFVVPLVVASTGGAVLIIMVLIFIMSRRFKRKKHEVGMSQAKSKSQSFSYNEIHSITQNFKTEIGKGGFGQVYHGTLEDGREVAIKLHSESSNQGYQEFQSEVHLLTVVHHRNLVSFVGYCDEGEIKALVYEYMAKGNLQQQLSVKNSNVLKWEERLQIAVDAANGLDYLHNGCKPPIVHRDLKSSNILLNENLQAKISDFGLSREFAKDLDTHISTRPAGTPGYLDPEFHSSGNLNRKSDVYSFGIILLELITGQPAIRGTPGNISHILHWVTPKLESGDIQSIVDSRLQGNYSTTSAWKFLEIAMSCTPPVAIQRPDISYVVSELKECLALQTTIPTTKSNDENSNYSLDTTYFQIDLGTGPAAR